MAQIVHNDIGDVWTPQATFTVGGTATDPTALTITVLKPDGTTSVYNAPNPLSPPAGVTRVSAGVFKLAEPLTLVGHWYARFVGTGTAQAAEEHETIVDPSSVVDDGVSIRALVTLEEAKDWLNQNNVDTREDLEIVRVINDISNRFHREARREFRVYGTNPQTRIFNADALGIWSGFVAIGDMASAPTAIQILSTDWTTVVDTPASTEWLTWPTPRNPDDPIRALQFATTVSRLRTGMRVSVTGNFGFPSVPGDVRQAVLDAVVENLDRDVQHWRQDFSPVQQGEAANVVVVGNTGPRVVRLPPRVLAVAWDYRDRNVA